MADDESDEELRKYIKQMIREETGGGNIGGGSSGGEGVNLGEFGKFVMAAKGMKEAMTSDVDKALSTAVSNKIVDQVIPSMSPQPRASGGFLDTGFAIAFAQKLPEQIATIADVLFTRIGPDRTGKLVDGIHQKFLGGGGSSGELNEDDIIGALDPDNPAHLHQYMAYKKIGDPDIAKRTLIAEKDKIMKRVASGSGGNGGFGANDGVVQMLENQNAVLKDLIQAKTEDRKVMEALFNEINKLKAEKGGFDIDSVDNGKHVDELGLPIKEKSVKVKKPEESSEEEASESGEEVPAVKLEDVVIKEKSVKNEAGDGNVEDRSVEDGSGNVEEKKITVIMKKGGSKPKFD